MLSIMTFAHFAHADSTEAALLYMLVFVLKFV